MDVAEVDVVRWPDGAEDRDRSAAMGRACLLLLVDGPAPDIDHEREDWLRVPASADDVALRAELLVRRWVRRDPPTVDEHDVLRYGPRLVTLPETEARLARLLVDRFATVASRAQLMAVGWADGSGTRNALDIQMVRLRRRVAEVGLRIRTVRGRGYLLERQV